MIPDNFSGISLKTWFPGHMTKGGRQMAEAVKLVDLVVELVDSRAPETTRNPQLDKLFANKPRLLLANKADLAAPAISRRWTQWYQSQGVHVMFLEARSKGQVKPLIETLKRLVAEERQARGATRPLLRPPRIMIAGVPNVGKSTLINHSLDRNKTQVGPKPGVTRATQWVQLVGGVDLLDTPGMLWPTIRDPLQGLMLALLGIFNEDLIPPTMLAEFLAWKLETLQIRIDWTAFGLDSPPESGPQLFAAYAKKRAFLAKGGELDLERAATTFLKDFRDGRLGRITLELPPAPEQ